MRAAVKNGGIQTARTPLPDSVPISKAVGARGFAAEPFRLFFPAATIAGIVGVLMWPLHLMGLMETFPGQIHARVMTHGMFGGFIFGFLGTAMPRMLSAKRLGVAEAFPLLLAHLLMIVAYASNHLLAGNVLFLLKLAGLAAIMLPRFNARKDLPPPGFILVALALGCAAVGAGLSFVPQTEDSSPLIPGLQKLLSYQGFVLLPIIGIGPFILPRFFGLASSHDLPEALRPTDAWKSKALLALATGVMVIGTFFMEALGWIRLAHAVRFLATLAYMAREFPAAPKATNVFGAAIRISVFGILAGFLAVAIWPAYRTGLLHLTLVGGFAIITFVVATRVLFGHSGNIALLQKRSRWFVMALGLMLFGMATRISGDFWPKIMASHYIYGAFLWIAGVILWAIYTLPKVLRAEAE
jgi:uncharacterized protein involved in response to NO